MFLTRDQFFNDGLIVLSFLLLVMIARLNTHQFSLQTEVATTEGQASDLAQENRRLKHNLTASRARVKKLATQAANLNIQKAKVGKKLKATQKTVAIGAKNLKALQVQLVDTSKMLAREKTKVAELVSALNVSQTTLGHREEEVLAAQQAINTLDRDSRALAKKLQILQEAKPFLEEATALFLRQIGKSLGDNTFATVGPDRVVLPSDALFGVSGAPSAAGWQSVVQVVEAYQNTLKNLPQGGEVLLYVAVHGHQDISLDALAPVEDAKVQTDQQARVLKDFLTDQGLSARDFVVQSMGALQPLDARGDEFSARRNRRVEIKLIQIK